MGPVRSDHARDQRDPKKLADSVYTGLVYGRRDDPHATPWMDWVARRVDLAMRFQGAVSLAEIDAMPDMEVEAMLAALDGIYRARKTMEHHG